MTRTLALALSTAAVLITGAATAQPILKREPQRGLMRPNDVVLVDDGSCPKGQIKRVTGGTFGATGSRGSGGARTSRGRTCVPRPR